MFEFKGLLINMLYKVVKKNEGFKIAHITSMIFMYYKMVKKKINRKN